MTNVSPVTTGYPSRERVGWGERAAADDSHAGVGGANGLRKTRNLRMRVRGGGANLARSALERAEGLADMPQEAPMQHQLVTTRERPSRAQIQPAALELLSRHSAGLLATARRYSATPEDAEDAYQRGVEILLTKAPTTTETELLPWLRTVVKHEAFAVRKSGARAVPTDAPGAHERD